MKKLFIISFLIFLYQISFGQAKMQLNFKQEVVSSENEIGFPNYFVFKEFAFGMHNQGSFKLSYLIDTASKILFKKVVQIKNKGNDTLHIVFINSLSNGIFGDSFLINIPPYKADSIQLVENSDSWKNSGRTTYCLISNATNYPHRLFLNLFVTRSPASKLKNKIKIQKENLNLGKIKYGKTITAKVLIINKSTAKSENFLPIIYTQNQTQFDVDYLENKFFLNSKKLDQNSHDYISLMPNDTLVAFISFHNKKGKCGIFKKLFWIQLNNSGSVTSDFFPISIKGKYKRSPNRKILINRTQNWTDTFTYNHGIITKHVHEENIVKYRIVRTYDNKGILKKLEKYLGDELNESYDFDDQKPRHYIKKGIQY